MERSSVETGLDEKYDVVRAAFSVIDGLNPRAVAIPVTRIEGITVGGARPQRRPRRGAGRRHPAGRRERARHAGQGARRGVRLGGRIGPGGRLRRARRLDAAAARAARRRPPVRAPARRLRAQPDAQGGGQPPGPGGAHPGGRAPAAPRRRGPPRLRHRGGAAAGARGADRRRADRLRGGLAGGGRDRRRQGAGHRRARCPTCRAPSRRWAPAWTTPPCWRPPV